jgi:hypothetical protein
VALLCLFAGFYRHAALSVLCEALLLFLSYAPEMAAALPLHHRALVGAYATLLPMTQDAVRLGSKLRRGRWSQICLRFDWMDGKGDADHVPATQLATLIKLGIFLLASVTLSLLHHDYLPQSAVCAVLLLSGLAMWAVGQRHAWRVQREPQRGGAEGGPDAFSVRKRAGAIGCKLFPDHVVGVSAAQQELCIQV